MHRTSILDVYEVFKHLDVLWMGIWVHPYTVMPLQVEAKFGEIGGTSEPKTSYGHVLRL